jgi:hypothetical protein
VQQGVAPLEGMGGREETLALWRETCGKSTDDVEWYEAFAGFKMECQGLRMLAAGMLPKSAQMSAPGARTLETLRQIGAARRPRA